MAEDITTKCIGKLTLDISDVDKKVRDVNNFLNKIGANVNLEKKLSEGIRNALNKLVNEAQKAGEEASKAIDRVGGSGKAEQKLEGLESNMVRLMSEVKTFGRTADETGHTIEKLTGTIQTGFDDAGNKIKEFVNAEGEITKRTEEVRNSIEDQIDAMWKLHDAEEAAYQKQGEAAVKAGLQREEAAAKAAQREEELTQKQVATMEESIAKRTAAEEAALEKEVASFERAEEKKRQASIEAEFEREEARRKAHQAEEETIAKEIAMMDESLAKKEADLEKEIADYEQAEERKRQAAINAEFEREEARKKSVQAEEEAIAREIAMMDEAIAKKEQEFQSGKITEAEQAYKRLTNAISQYQIAKKAGNQEQMDYWQNEMNAAMSTLSSLEKLLPELKLEESARERIVQLINAAKTQQDGFEKGVIGTSQATGELESQVKGLLTRYLSLMAVIRAISSLVRNMTEYVSEYSDKMNEIQMITLKTDSEVEQLAETYRNLAKDMSVSSLDMADAAIYFTRQGLAADEIEKRLKNVTMYAKAANVEFKDASEIITAVVNSMGLVEQEAEDGRNAAQRVADVFLAIGDSAATSGQEIGEAMQKAAASAGAFGVSMEWLASYIATVSETTRQEARTIGTAFNTIIARLHQIKSTGYNQEDETKVNDIAKALSKVDVTLMDQAGNWRDMEIILEEVASKWDGLDGKTKSYIATTMAGVKQQNVFLALMNDMSKGIEDGSRAYELHEKALDSVGVAEQKYGVYLDSITASQEKLTVAQEEFYSLLNENVIKGWNNALAGFINMLNSGADAWGSWTIALPVVAALITGLIVAIKGVNMGLKETITLSTMLEKHPVMMAITAAIAAGSLLVTAINAIADAIGSSEERFNNAKEAIDKYNTSIQNAEKNQKSLAELQKEIEENTELSSKELSNYNSLLTSLESISVRAKNAVISLKNGFGSQSDQVAILNEELDAYIEKQHRLAAMEGVTKYSNYQTENSTYEFASLVPNWQGGFNDLDSFTSALRDTYQISKLGYVNPNSLLPIDVRDQIEKWFKDAGMAPFGDNTEELWKEIAKNIWLSYFGGDTSFNISEYLANEVNASIDDAMQLVGFKLNPVDYAVVKQFLTNQIFGEDMELSQEEYKEFSDKISSFIQDMILHGFDPSYLNIPVEEKMVQYVSSIFADVGEELSSAVANDIRDVFGGNTELYESFISAISEAMDAGFDKEDIYDVLFSTPIEEWDQAIDIFKENILSGLRDLFSSDEEIGSLEELADEMHFFDSLEEYFANMSISEAKSLNDMITSLLDVDVDVSKIKEAIATAETIEEVFESLKKLQEENGVDTTNEEGGVVGTLKEFIKEAKAGIKDIQAIDAAIESVKKNIAEGENINYGDIFGLIELHPEIMTVIGDSEKLLETLKKVREEAGKTQFDSFRNLLLDKGTTAGTKYADSGFETLAEYRASIEGNEEAVKEFNEEIDRLAQNLQLADENFKQTTKDEKEATKSFSESVKEVEKFDSVIKKIKDNKAVDFSNIIDLSTAHPELIAVSGDMNEVLKVLEKLKAEAQETVRLKVESSVLTSEDWFKKSKFAGKNGATTAQGYRESLLAGGVTEEEAKELKALDDAIDESTANVVGLADAYATLEKSEKDATEAAKEEKNALKEAQKAFNDNLKEVETLDKVISKLQDDKKVDFSDIINLSSSHPEIVAYANDAEKLIEVLQRLKEEAKGTTKQNIKDILMDSEEYFKGTEYYDPESGITTMRDYITSLHESRGDWHTVASEVDKAAQDIVDAADSSSTAADTWLEAQMKIAEINDEVNWAKANNFEDQIRQLQAANEAGGIQDAIALFDSWDKEMQQAVGTEYPAFILQMVKARKAMNDQGKETADLTQQTEALSAAINNVQKLNEVKHFTDTASAIKKLSDGTISAADAYDVLTKDLNKVTKAYEDVLSVQAKQSYNEQEKDATKHQSITETDVTNLASLLGMTTDQILADFPGAVSMFDELIGKTGELQDVINMLNDTAFIRITGTSDADFSAIQAGLISVENLAEEAIQKLKETGQWEVVPLEMNQTAALWNWDNEEKTAGHWSYDYTTVGAQVLKPTGKNPLFTGSSSVKGKTPTNTKSRGGGGGSNKDKNDNFRDKNTTTEVEKMLDLMSQVNAIQQYQQSYYQSQNKYYSQTGQLQGVIAYMQKEKEVLEGQNGTLESNIKRIEEYMSAKQAELATLSTEDEKYKEVADDFDKLQKAHQTYTKQLIDNKSAVEALNQAMEEQRKKIRQMEIDLRNLILGAIEDREKKRTDMLNAEIEMENTIYDLIVKRYEKERDEIIRTTELKIDALNSERDLLEENLRIRKEEAEQEDKAAKLRELEVKYQRIIADPTRAKEAQQLKTEIDSLRKEMAWDIAEEEVKSQQDSIDQQIESLEDYKEYIENYYADLFEHPQQLIAEMREIMMGTQEEIINWLKQNDDAYRESSENTQLAMATGWEETYNNMKGILKTYWDEVEEIIAQGDDYIIEFLKNNSADYAAAGKLQAEAYVDEWKKQLEDLHKAHQTVSAEIAGSYATIQQYNGNGSSNSSSNGGSSVGGGTSKTTTTTANMTASAGGSHYYEFTAFGKNYSADKNSSGQYFANRGEAYSAAEQKIDALYQSQKATLDKNGANAYGYNQLAQAYKTAKNSIRAYKTGGIADYTGPAWVDGSPQDPERILTPYQNKLFESMVSALEKMSTLTIPSMPNFGALQTTGANPVSVGDIIVNVDNLDTDDDYEEMADRVCEILTERIGRTAVVGGLRIRST